MPSDDDLFGQEHVRVYRQTDGVHGYHWRGTTILLLTTTGRASNEERTTPLIHRTDGEDWVVVAANDPSSGLAFQLAADHRPPTWPDPAIPQQFHLDVMVEDVASAGLRVLALGAAKLDGEDVYADPAGHPFCLIRRPGWAPPVVADD